MIMNTLRILYLVVASAVCSVSGQSDDGRHGTLHVYLVSHLGGKLSTGTLSIRSKEGALLYTTNARGEVRTRLPYGDYIVSFMSEFLQPVSRAVTVESPDCFMVLASGMARIVLDGRNDPVSVSLKVQNPSGCTTGGFLWAKLTGVFSDYSTERKVSTHGFALFEPVEVGAYVVMVIDGEQVRALQPVKTWGQVTNVEISLTPCK
jgi:hypothetical protein